ncbi:MAG: methylmalonyl-CoA mutase, partial [Gemmatimonadetes bacterium]|nr:methylmalonyl-CoA mutase [Gemmatimonadota bacterium]
VGVNQHVDEAASPRIGQPDYSTLERGQVERLASMKAERDLDGVASALAAVRARAGSDENLVPAFVEAVKVGVTLGEISDALREEWGTYDG